MLWATHREGITCQGRSDDQRISDGLTLVQNLQLQTRTTVLMIAPKKESIFSNMPTRKKGKVVDSRSVKFLLTTL
jgi:hypothetical protein